MLIYALCTGYALNLIARYAVSKANKIKFDRHAEQLTPTSQKSLATKISMYERIREE